MFSEPKTSASVDSHGLCSPQPDHNGFLELSAHALLSEREVSAAAVLHSVEGCALVMLCRWVPSNHSYRRTGPELTIAKNSGIATRNCRATYRAFSETCSLSTLPARLLIDAVYRLYPFTPLPQRAVLCRMKRCMARNTRKIAWEMASETHIV